MQAFALSDVKAYMGHADIQTTMRFVHHVPQHDAAEQLTKLCRSAPRSTLGARPGARDLDNERGAEAESPPERAISDGPGWTRTTDLRIMSPLL